MRHPGFITSAVAAIAVTLGALAFLPTPGRAQEQPAPSPPKAYKIVPIRLPTPISDPTFDAFRKQLGEVAAHKDRAALGKLVMGNFFWIQNGENVAEKGKAGLDVLAEAIGLDGQDADGWDSLAAAAAEPTASPHAQRKGVVCAPVMPSFDVQAFEALTEATETEPGEWGYPVRDGVEVRSAARADAPVLEKLGLHMVRVYPDDSPAAAVLGSGSVRIVLPSGKLGFVPTDALNPIDSDQICYVKDSGAWKIAGVIGGSQ
jgi:hypothetical protein